MLGGLGGEDGGGDGATTLTVMLAPEKLKLWKAQTLINVEKSAGGKLDEPSSGN